MRRGRPRTRRRISPSGSGPGFPEDEPGHAIPRVDWFLEERLQGHYSEAGRALAGRTRASRAGRNGTMPLEAEHAVGGRGRSTRACGREVATDEGALDRSPGGARGGRGLRRQIKEEHMRLITQKRLGLIVVPMALAILADASFAQYVYPAKGQTPQQQQADQTQCQSWALQASGVNPGAPPPSTGGGQVAGTAARGAAVGAVGGAIGGNAGKGAAIGAATGALVGGMRRRDERRQAEAYQAQAADASNRAYGACLEGRGYTVK